MGLKTKILFLGTPVVLAILFVLIYPYFPDNSKSGKGFAYDVVYTITQLYIYSGICYAVYVGATKLIKFASKKNKFLDK